MARVHPENNQVDISQLVTRKIGDTGYSISECGRVINPFGRLLSPFLTRIGYSQLKIKSSNGLWLITIHRLVAQAFVPNPHNLPFVNHKDGNKSNNHFSNLEWTDNKGNMKHAFKMTPDRFKQGGKAKEIIQMSLDGQIINTYPSLRNAQKTTGIEIKKCLRGIHRTAGGFLWQYKSGVTTYKRTGEITRENSFQTSPPPRI